MIQRKWEKTPECIDIRQKERRKFFLISAKSDINTGIQPTISQSDRNILFERFSQELEMNLYEQYK